jgi:glycosyltransferase involved in cell wall biosynthesis
MRRSIPAKDMTHPAVSVLVDTYNHESFIEDAIVSVLEQDLGRENFEIVVIDDGSTDDTPRIVKKFLPRVRYLHKTNGGQGSAFNAGIPEVQGEILAFLDGDDWWAPNKLRTVVEALEREPDAGSVGHGIIEYRGPSQQRVITPKAQYRLHLHNLEGAGLFRNVKAFLGTSRLAARKRVLEKVLPVPPALTFEADEYLFTTVTAVADLLLLPQALTYYRLHDNNLFQYRVADETKMRRKHHVLAELVRTLPPALNRLGVEQSVVDTVIEPIWVDAERLRLSLEGGTPWETFRVERTAFRIANQDVSLRYRLLKSAFLALGLVLPPRRFFQLRRWYAAKGYSKMWQWLRRHTPAPPVIHRWQETI